MSATSRKQGTFTYDEAGKYSRKSPKFGPNGTKHGSKAERKYRAKHNEYVKANQTN